jgi:hypothetical protein
MTIKVKGKQAFPEAYIFAALLSKTEVTKKMYTR